jgi:hypothetical protein
LPSSTGSSLTAHWSSITPRRPIGPLSSTCPITPTSISTAVRSRSPTTNSPSLHRATHRSTRR